MSAPREGAAEERARTLKMLRQTPVFRNVSVETLERRVLPRLERVAFRAGDRLGAAQGEVSDAMFVVTEGSVMRQRQRENGRRLTHHHVVSPTHADGTASFSVQVKPLPNSVSSPTNFQRAQVTVRGPDVDGLLGAISRALYSAGLSIESCQAGVDAGQTSRGRALIRDVFVVTWDKGSPTEAAAAMRLTAVVREACKHVLGSARDRGGVHSFGALHFIERLPAFATTTAQTDGVAWRLPSAVMAAELCGKEASEHLALDVAGGLCSEVFRLSEAYSPTPLFEQPPKRINFSAISVAAAFESYYRSMMNAVLNAKLSGTAPATLFPDMHLQIPARVLYINGFKWLRQTLDDLVGADADGRSERDRFAYSLIPALLPGVIMTPVSSLLEALNAGHANKEPLLRRCMRGSIPRTGREVIFGLGLNNLADWCEERVPAELATSKLGRSALGSMAAGVCAGYLSHVPHNLSTLKILEPSVSYAGHWQKLVDNARLNRLPPALPERSARILANALAIFLPAGLCVRTAQIVGSFCLLNGITNALDT